MKTLLITGINGFLGSNLAKHLKSTHNIVGFTGELHWDSTKPDGTPRKLMNVSKINNLGRKEKVALDEGIERVYGKFCS